MILTGLSIFAAKAYRQAAAPLFATGDVDAIEWSVDAWREKTLPDETADYLAHFSDQQKLIGHGIHYPLLSADADDLRSAWLNELRADVKKRSYDGLSVHFGFSTGWRIREGAPLPVPLCAESLVLGKQSMRQLQDAAGCKVGIENLALAFSKQDVADQGQFIDELLQDVDGYLLLDLHNIYCQSVNFDVPMMDLVKTYPLSRVHEIHVSGGSWSEVKGRRICRDTHDGRVPDEILAVLPQVAQLCPQLKYVLLEKLPQSFATDQDAVDFRDDYRKVQYAVALI